MALDFSDGASHVIEDAILVGVRDVVRRFRADHADHHLYGFALVSYPEQRAPHACLFTEEGLAEVVAAYRGEDDEEGLRWSYADSPFDQYPYPAPDPLDDARRLLDERLTPFQLRSPTVYLLDEHLAAEEEGFRIRAMERALRRADEEGLFAPDRERVVLILYDANAGDLDIDARGTLERLNPREVLSRYHLQ